MLPARYRRPALGRLVFLVLLLTALAGLGARAQAPAWGGVAGATALAFGNLSRVQGVAADGRGNVFVVGWFNGSVAFGATTLTSAGLDDWFVAKYSLASAAWVWAQRGGGTSNDQAFGVAVSGTSVYVTGYVANNSADAQQVRFGGTTAATSPVPVSGTSANASTDLVLVKYQDAGTSGAVGWTQVGGGTDNDQGFGVAVSGTSVYVTGQLINNTANANAVRFGGGGTTAGTVAVRGATPTLSADLVLSKWTDNGPAASYQWSQVGGGTSPDAGQAVAVLGASVYVTGYFQNTSGNSAGTVFGGNGTTAGTVAVSGAGTTLSRDLLLLKYTDQGSTATLGWTQVAGGTDLDQGNGVAVQGSSVYVAGTLFNDRANSKAVVLGGAGTTAGTARQYGAGAVASTDLLLAKYTDNGSTGSFRWSQLGGGTSYDAANAVVVSGSSVYVAGSCYNNAANAAAVVLGGSGTTAGTVPLRGLAPAAAADLVVASYTDQGSAGALAWVQVGGGPDTDAGYGLALSGQQVVVGGLVMTAATFGAYTVPNPVPTTLAVVARLLDNSLPLATRAGPASAALRLYPNPATGAATLSGTAPGALVQVLDALGRVVVATATADGTAALGALPAGVYVVRAGAGAVRLVVE